jgi:hypothetical protein
MKNSNLFTVIVLCLFSYFTSAQVAPEIQWQNTIGGNSFDYMRYLIQTSDGGYLLGGESGSNISGDKTEAGQGSADYWVVKLDGSGNIIWQNTIGGSDYDYLYSVIQTFDGGYLLGGLTSSGISGDKTEAGQGSADYWVVKLDASGNILWQNTIGGSSSDNLRSVIQTSDGGYLLGGYSSSGISGDKTEANQGIGYDYWVVKLDASGNLLWQNTIGGSDYDYLYSVIQTTDEGYLLGGSSRSGISGDKTEPSQAFGLSDNWVVKLDASGNILWQNTIGGTSSDNLRSVIQTSDGGYLLGGESYSDISGDKTEASQGSADYWVVKLDGSGSIIWQNTIGGSKNDFLFSVIQTSNGGYLLGGDSESGISGDKIETKQGGYDYWVVQLDESGNILWQNTIGGTNEDNLSSVIQTTDGGYVLGGISLSGISGDKTEASQGDADYWIVKLSAEVASECMVPTSLLTVNVTPIKATLKWDAVLGAIGYRVKYKPAGASEWSHTISTNNQITINDLIPNTEYSCQVKTVCSKSPLATSESSAYLTFITLNFKFEDEMFSNKSSLVSGYPNPVKNQLTINMSMPSGDITISINNLEGKRIELPITIQDTEAQINTSVLQNGFYMVQITNNKTGNIQVFNFIKH